MAYLSSSVFLVSALIVFLEVANIANMSEASCASCPITHPQQKFCNAEFVYKVRPISWQYVDIEGNPVLYASQAYDVQYKVKVENVFKGQESLAKDGAIIFLHSPKNLCLIDKLEMGIKYLISADMRGEIIQVTACGIVQKWSDLTPSQRRGVRGFYQSQCSSCKVFGSAVQRYYGGDEIIDEMSSGLWSKRQCFYNPLASVTYGSEECETKHAYCVHQKDGVCGWEGGEAYEQCFRQREYNWQLMQFAEIGLAAWTCPEQCKDLTPRRLKYKCKKATRKMPPCNSRDTVREFEPEAALEAVRTVDPNTIDEVPPTESPEILAALSALFD
ncbi:metalloproteinase inhibitor 1-like [Strongylocentrotus purpuratus]|uniref:NTR domain-containing protein n=1 Tax=Strongylocentrotus purpuratus TaxID=7668 RepID=A0A7M7N147_STRPU|nr:metalloproteinase inhibitor 1-like [Strongylocentrotus purpuratus]|eukprot:XP_001198302.1 PREDICTED: metalloproteinase inhibitor 1 [Strongylocentrotus purpuratus]